jgi:hypothetical protein
LLVGVFLGIYPSGAFAQDADNHHVGIVIAYPSSVGAVFEMSPRIALRPDLFMSGSSLTQSGQTVSSRSIAVGLDVLIWLRRYDKVRTYVTPRVSYTHNTSNQPLAQDVWGTAGSYGVEYSATSRLAVFGEVGVFVGHSFPKTVTIAEGISQTAGPFTSWTTRAGVGIVFYP